MKEISIRCILNKTDSGFEVKPVTNADKVSLEVFYQQSQAKYIELNMRTRNATKSYEQIKTVWALITILFKSQYFRRPSKSELEQLHDELLQDYSSQRPSLLHPGTTVPVRLRDMSTQEMSRFIQSLINEICTSCDLEYDDQMSAKQVFCEWQNYMSSLDLDPNDCNEKGDFLSIEEWRPLHLQSFATGRSETPEMQLDLAHIVSRGADQAHKDCCWNVMMLTHEEHMLQHDIGWDNFLELYPHLRGRVERARRLAGKRTLHSTVKREIAKENGSLSDFLGD